MDLWRIVAAVAARQHGAITRWQLGFLGVGPAVVQDRLEHHGWRRIYPGVYVLPGVQPSPVGRAAAALLAYSRPTTAGVRADERIRDGLPPVDALVAAAFGPWAVISGRSAAFLHGLVKDEPRPVQVLLPPTASLTTHAGVRLGYAVLDDCEMGSVAGLPVVMVERAVADIAGMTPEWKRAASEVARVIATADALRLTDVDRIQEAAAARGAFKGTRALDHAIAGLRGTLSHSGTEAWARRKVTEIAQRYGLTVHPRPYPILHRGRRVAEADIAVMEICYDLEVDGPHHFLPAQVVKDRQRDRRAVEAGWAVDRHPVMEIEAAPRVFLAQVDVRIRSLSAQKRRSHRNSDAIAT